MLVTLETADKFTCVLVRLSIFIVEQLMCFTLQLTRVIDQFISLTTQLTSAVGVEVN